MGYHRAGFDVVGVDIKPQPRYPFTFIRADATSPPLHLSAFDAIHASPPCQAYTSLRAVNIARGGRSDHPQLVDSTRDLLAASGVPWVMENVPGSPVAPMVQLCGTSFDLGIPGFKLRRHRWFEVNGFWMLSPVCDHRGNTIGVYGQHGRDRRRAVETFFSVSDGRVAMGIDWMTGDELSQAIPPAYTEFIGRQLLAELERAKVG